MLVQVKNEVVSHEVNFMFGEYFITFYDSNHWSLVVTTKNKDEIDDIIKQHTHLEYKVNPHLTEDFDDMGNKQYESSYHYEQKKERGTM